SRAHSCATSSSFHAGGKHKRHARHLRRHARCLKRRTGHRHHGHSRHARSRVHHHRAGKRRAHHTRTADAGSDCRDVDLMPNGEDLDRVRAATLCLVNREREAHGEGPLQPNGRLETAAQRHSEEMSLGDYFEHRGLQGGTPLSRMRAAGYVYSSQIGFEVGENLGWGTLWLATPRAIVAAWMNSPEHRANILNGHYRDTAIGVSPHPIASLAHGQAGAIYTQDFGLIITA